MTKLLPWEQTDDNNWTARTKIDDYHVWMCDFNGECNLIFEASRSSEWRTGLGTHPTLDAAISACESDYVSRCTEFLRVAGAGEVVVPLDVAELARDVLNDIRNAPAHEVDYASTGLTAAIDAAGGGR